MPLPLHGHEPFPSAPQGRSRPLGTIPQGRFPQPPCVLCGRAAADPDLYFCAHFFCLVSAPGLLQLADRHSWPRVLGFLPEDIRCTVEWSQAACAGIAFNCPICRNEHEFLMDMLTMGIRIPLRLLEAEGLRTGAVPHNPVLRSLCPHSHEPFCFPRPWELLLCSSCAAEGTHRRCSNLRTSRTSWECESCTGQGTGKRQSTFMLLGWGQGPGKAWQQVPRLGLADPLCSRRAGGTALASPQWPLCL
uniref:PHF7/G2E3-like PHD zinc finger domain-containing protein n=1 Tax=Bubo bubo TaxID=30461 RepID=A0A8C0F6W0_BUBBB